MIGIAIGAFLAVLLLGTPDAGQSISEATRVDLAELGVADSHGLVPDDFFMWAGLATPAGFVLIVVGGFLVGFGARYAGGCTSGHAISGLADLQLPSLVAVVGFFAGGLFATHLLLPLLIGGGG